jgi:polyisoprenoid-binding protein YceI
MSDSFDIRCAPVRGRCNRRRLADAITPLAATNWRIDPARTHIAFVIDAVDFQRIEGRFQRHEGRVSVDFTGAKGRVARRKWARTCRAFSMGNIDP